MDDDGRDAERAALRSRAIGALMGVFVGDALAEVAGELRYVDGDEATGSLMGREGFSDSDGIRESVRAALQDAGEHAVARGESPLRDALMLFVTAVYAGHRFDEPWKAERFLAPSDIAEVFRAAAASEQRGALGVLALPLVIASASGGRTPRAIAEGIKEFAFGDAALELAFHEYAEAAHEAVVRGRIPAAVQGRLDACAAMGDPRREIWPAQAPFDGDAVASAGGPAPARDVADDVFATGVRALGEAIAGRSEERSFTRMPRALAEAIAHRVTGSASLPSGAGVIALSLAGGVLGTAGIAGALASTMPVRSSDDPLWLAGHAADQILGPVFWPRERRGSEREPRVVAHPDDAGIAFTRQAGVAAGLADGFDRVLTLTALAGVRPNQVGGRAMAVPWDLTDGRLGGEDAAVAALDFRDGAGGGPEAGTWRGAHRVADLAAELRRRGLTVAIDVGDRWQTAYAIAVHCRRELERRADWPEMLSPEILLGEIGEPDPGYRERRLLHPLIKLFPELEDVHEGYEGWGVDFGDDPGDADADAEVA